MKKIFIPILLSLMLGCDKGETIEKETTNEDICWCDPLEPANIDTIKKYHYDTISFVRIDLSEKNLKLYDIAVTYSVPYVVWSLIIQMGDSTATGTGGSIHFSLLDSNNNGDSLRQVGEHFATGHWGDNIFNTLEGNNFQLYELNTEEFSVYTEEYIEDIAGIFAKGLIDIKKELYWEWPACLLVGDIYIYPGDDEYLDYCKPFYYVPVKIYFDNLPK